jgi:hypothetical protein
MHIANLYNDCSSRDARDIDIYSCDSESNLVYMHMNRLPDEDGQDIKDATVKYEFVFCTDSRDKVLGVIDETMKMHHERDEDVSIKISFVETFSVSDDDISSAVDSWLNAGYDFDNDEVKFSVVTEPSVVDGWSDYDEKDMPF